MEYEVCAKTDSLLRECWARDLEDMLSSKQQPVIMFFANRTQADEEILETISRSVNMEVKIFENNDVLMNEFRL